MCCLNTETHNMTQWVDFWGKIMGRKRCLHENFELWSTSQSDKREMAKQYWRCLRVTSEIWMEKRVWISLMGHQSLMINWFWVMLTLTQRKKFNMRRKKKTFEASISLGHKVYNNLESGGNEEITDQRFTQMKTHLNTILLWWDWTSNGPKQLLM